MLTDYEDIRLMLSQSLHSAADELTSCVQGPAKAERVELPMLPSIAQGSTIEQFPGSCSELLPTLLAELIQNSLSHVPAHHAPDNDHFLARFLTCLLI